MRTINQTLYRGLILAIVAGLCGCQNETDTKKKAFLENYQGKSSPVKLTVIRGQLDNGQTEDARKALQELIAEDAENAAALSLMGRVLIAQRNLTEAQVNFEKAIALNEPTGEAFFGMGVIAQSGDDHTVALDYYQKALDLAPINTECILAVTNTLDVLGRSDDAASLLDAKLSIKPSDSTLLMTAAALASRAGNTDKAIRLYQRAAAADPKNTKALQSLAMLYISSGNWASAADTYEKAMAVADASETENYLQRLASCSFNAARFRTALDSYDKLSVLRRDDPDIWLGIAQSALGVSNLKRARYAAQKTLSLKNDCDEARLVLGCADYLDGKYLTALESFNKLVTDDKAGSFATFMVGRCYLKLGRTKQAQAAFDKATLTAPESPLVSIFLNETK